MQQTIISITFYCILPVLWVMICRNSAMCHSLLWKSTKIFKVLSFIYSSLFLNAQKKNKFPYLLITHLGRNLIDRCAFISNFKKEGVGDGKYSCNKAKMRGFLGSLIFRDVTLEKTLRRKYKWSPDHWRGDSLTFFLSLNLCIFTVFLMIWNLQ